MTVRVWVVKPKSGRRSGRYILRWDDPRTGKRKQRTLKTGKFRDAQRAANELEEELSRGSDGKMYWEEFEELYFENHLKNTSRGNQGKWDYAVSYLKKCVPDPDAFRLEQINGKLLMRFETLIREELAEGSVDSYVGTLRAGLNFAASLELIPPLPPRRRRGRRKKESSVLRLRAVTLEDLERIEAKLPDVVGDDRAEEFQRFARVLWLSGCRLLEPMSMHWSRIDCHRPQVLEGSRPTFIFTASQKNRTDQVARITRDFADWLLSQTKTEGWIVSPVDTFGRRAKKDVLGKAISKACVLAGVRTSVNGFANAKQFRSSFGTRWAGRGVPPAILQNMMRHESIQTTMQHYVGNMAEAEWVEDCGQTCDQTTGTTDTRKHLKRSEKQGKT